MHKELAKRLENTPANRTALRLGDFTLSEDIASERTEVASVEAELRMAATSLSPSAVERAWSSSRSPVSTKICCPEWFVAFGVKS